MIFRPFRLVSSEKKEVVPADGSLSVETAWYAGHGVVSTSSNPAELGRVKETTDKQTMPWRLVDHYHAEREATVKGRSRHRK